MAIKVEYNATSSTSNWWNNTTPTDGTNVDINDNTAIPIYKDSKQGKTNVKASDLQDGGKTPAAQVLNSYIEDADEDEIEFTRDEMYASGQDQIDTDNTDEYSDGSKKGGASAAVIGGAVGATAGIVGSVGRNAGSALGKSIAESGTKAAEKASENATSCSAQLADGFTQLIIAGIMLAGAIVAAATAWAVDPAWQKRKAETSAAESNDATINTYKDDMGSIVGNILNEQKEYEELSAMKLDTMMGSLDEMTKLKTEQATYERQGNTEKSNQLQKTINEMAKGGTEEEQQYNEGLDKLSENLNDYSLKAAEAEGVKDSGDSVAAFLNEGTMYGALAVVAGVLNGVGLACALIATLAMPKFGALDAAPCIAAKALFITSAALYGVAVGFDITIAKDDFAAAKAGKTMGECLTSLDENTNGVYELVGDTGSQYAEIQSQSAQTYEGAAEGSNEVIKNTQKGEDSSNEPEGDEGNKEITPASKTV